VSKTKAAHCRFAKMDDSGRIPFVYINTDWSNANKEYSVPIPFMDAALEIKNIAKQKNI
jgi:hypothetical protein